MKKLLTIKNAVLLLAIISLLGFSGVILKNKFLPEKKVHYHAGFIVFKDDKKLDFSDFKYMFEKPCTINGKDDEENENDQLEKAHLHDNVGDVVHIERDGARWKDLFTNINYPIDYSKTTGYINGKKVENYQAKAITPDEILVVFIGKNDINTDLVQAPSKEYVEKMAKKSTTCGD